MRSFLVICALAATGALAATNQIKTDFPIVAIMSHRHHQPENPNCGMACDTIEASYVKWVESAGARAVPVPYDASDATVEAIFHSANGLLLPGGGVPLSDAAKKFLTLARDANAGGADYFPVWGTCLGFEWLLQFEAGTDKILDEGFDSENLTLALDFSDYGAQSSRVFTSNSTGFGAGAAHTGYDVAAVRGIFADKGNPVTMNNHGSGLEPRHLAANAKLAAFYKITATNLDRKGRAFVSAIEAADPRQPFYGVQFHPEKSQYEFGMVVHSGGRQHAMVNTAAGVMQRAVLGGQVAPGEMPFEVINHSREAVLASQFLADFFVNECRKSGHHYASAAEEQAALMYNFVYNVSQYEAPEFVQTYYLHYSPDLLRV